MRRLSVSRRLIAVAMFAAAACVVACGGTHQDRTFQVMEMDPLTLPDDETPADAEPLDRSQPPEPGEARPYTLPDVRDLTLPNGLTVTLVHRPGYPTVATRLSIRAGLDASNAGVALPELTARVIRDGTTTRSDTEIAEFIDGSGIAFNVGVGPNRVVMSADAVSTQVPQALELITDLVANATFPDERVEARREEALANLVRLNADPEFHRDRLLRRVAFGTHSYSRQFATVAELESIVPEDLRQFYRAAYAPHRSRLVMVGELPEDIDAQLTATLGTWANEAPAYGPPPNIEPATCNEAHVVIRPESVQTSIMWVGPGIAINAADHFSAVVANQVFGGGPSARLFLNLREDKSFTYGAYSRTSDMLGAAYFVAFANVRGEVTAAALDEFEYEIERVHQEPIPADELTDAISYLSGVFPIQLETNAQLAGKISGLLDIGMSLDYLVEYRDRVTAVGVDDASFVGRTFVNRPRLALVMVGTEADAVPAAQAHASRVFVYDLNGELVETLDGALESTCE